MLRQGIQGISDLIIQPGMINLDFADVKSIMRDAGSALMAIGRGTGENRTADAARNAIESPLLEMSIDGATGVLYNITGGTDLTLAEINEAAEVIRGASDDEAEIIFGTSLDESLGRDVAITLIATGFQGSRTPRRGVDRRQPRERERERVVEREPQRQERSPVAPDDEWAEPAILRFLRDK